MIFGELLLRIFFTASTPRFIYSAFALSAVSVLESAMTSSAPFDIWSAISEMTFASCSELTLLAAVERLFTVSYEALLTWYLEYALPGESTNELRPPRTPSYTAPSTSNSASGL